MTIQDAELLREFVTEANEHLADIENQLLAIEAGGAEIDTDLVNTVFRGIHSIKGAAGFLGLTVVNRLAHSMENVLNLIRNRELIPTTERVEALLKSADTLCGLVNDLDNSNTCDVTTLVVQLERIQNDGQPPAPINLAPASPTPVTEFVPSPVAPPATPIVQEVPPVTSIPTEPVATPAAVETSATTDPATKAAAHGGEANIRVPVAVVEHLMNLAGELVLGRNQLVQAVQRNDRQTLNNATSGLNQVTSELQETIMRTRMQPVRVVFGRFPRLVRDLSAKLGKQVELVVSGDDVEVDKTIIEAIGDPLTHLIRNSLDHGIETPAARDACGKSRQGVVRLKAYHQAGKVRIDVEDDGGGIDPSKLRQKAVSMGLYSADRAAQLSDREAVRLIFHPGLSTAAKVTDVSGRGVGMDVVKTNIERLGGAVDVESTVGKGSTIRITLPLTLAIIPSLIVRCHGKRFAVPQLNIVELVRLRAGETADRIRRVHHSQVLRLRDTLLPLVRLDAALGWHDEHDHTPDPGAVNVLVVESSELRFGVIVDGLCDSEEIVVKPLGRHVKDSCGMAGATILGDGAVALILDIDSIVRRFGLQRAAEQAAKEDDAKTIANGRGRLKVMLFENHPDELFAVPMALVSRIERVREEQIESIGGTRILKYQGSTLPLIKLDEHLKARPSHDCRRPNVIVFNAGGSEVGLLAPRLEDIREIEVTFDTVTLREPGVLGGFVLEGRAVRLIDIFELVEKARPELKRPARPLSEVANRLAMPEAAAPAQATIVLAEDSPFFQKQVRGFLEGEGYRVEAFLDGKQAWDYLQTHPDIQLVLTDVEMPVMTGLQLARRIKDDARFQHLPVIALTTLAGQDAVAQGYAAGVNDYQIKMDRDQLLESVARLIAAQRGGNQRSLSAAR